MAESPETPIPPLRSSSSSRGTEKEEKAWHSYISEDLPRTVQQSTDSAIRSARSFQQSSSIHFRAFQEFLPQLRTRYKTYEDAFFQKVKGELVSAREHPAVASGIAVTIGLLLMRGPRRFLFRHTLGRFQSEEAQFVRIEKNVRELNLSVDLMKKESRKLLERAALAQKDMRRGQSELANAGGQIRSLAKSFYEGEAEAMRECLLESTKVMAGSRYELGHQPVIVDLMDLLREIPGREALKLRVEVASMASQLHQQRIAMDKRILKISEYGVSV